MLYAQVHLTLPAWVHEAVDPAADYRDDDAKMALAIRLSALNVRHGSGGPFGAALFNAEGRLLGVGVNRVVPHSSSIAHAEMMAFATSQQRLQQYRLNAAGGPVTLATSSQPCCMCYGASVWAGIDRLLIGARAEDVESLAGFDEGPLPADWRGELVKRGIEVITDLRRDEARAVLAEYARGGVVY
ncbi:nucleoside deaminase [Silanimonas lenta]|uniref:nucleoside deaminase n=1 Tax=Silanimonas lenta TaxID=265429 RepID=UPI000428DD9F|nr:nucleoside deaminase [Silanimonas lenta]